MVIQVKYITFLLISYALYKVWFVSQIEKKADFYEVDALFSDQAYDTFLNIISLYSSITISILAIFMHTLSEMF